MALFYQGPVARITEKVFEVWYPTYRSYGIRQLTGVSIVQNVAVEPTDGPVLFASCGLAGAAALVAVLGWPVFGDPPISVVALLVMFAAVAVAGIFRRPRTVWYELWARYRDCDVCLFRCTDAQMFGQVGRALQRAIEANTR